MRFIGVLLSLLFVGQARSCVPSDKRVRPDASIAIVLLHLKALFRRPVRRVAHLDEQLRRRVAPSSWSQTECLAAAERDLLWRRELIVLCLAQARLAEALLKARGDACQAERRANSDGEATHNTAHGLTPVIACAASHSEAACGDAL